MRLPVGTPEGELEIQFRLMPFMGRSRSKQRLIVEINGTVVGCETISGATVLGFRLPKAKFGEPAQLIIRLRHPDCVSPLKSGDGLDPRCLAFCFWNVVVVDVKPVAPTFHKRRAHLVATPCTPLIDYATEVLRATGLSLDVLAMSFESLGLNCEFGLFQRRCGCDPIGLLRFAGISYLDLLNGLKLGFTGIDDVRELECTVSGMKPEWMITHSRYHLAYHTQRSPQDIAEHALLRQQSNVLAFKRRSFLETLTSGDKLFVVLRPEGMSLAQARPLLTTLQSLGRNALLFVDDQTSEPSGTVLHLAPGLFCGSMDGVEKRASADELVGRDTWLSDAAFAMWISICANVLPMWRAEQSDAEQYLRQA